MDTARISGEGVPPSRAGAWLEDPEHREAVVRWLEEHRTMVLRVPLLPPGGDVGAFLGAVLRRREDSIREGIRSARFHRRRLFLDEVRWRWAATTEEGDGVLSPRVHEGELPCAHCGRDVGEDLTSGCREEVPEWYHVRCWRRVRTSMEN